jgi:hypothetical protein
VTFGLALDYALMRGWHLGAGVDRYQIGDRQSTTFAGASLEWHFGRRAR